MKKKHKKHGQVTKPLLGQFARLEYAVMGTNCTRINEFCLQIAQYFTHKNISYLDANHKAINGDATENGFNLQYIDNISYQQFNLRGSLNSYQTKKYYNDADLVLINGNHFEGQSQIVFLDPEKEKSLYKRRHQLSNICLYIELDNSGYFPIFLEEHQKSDQIIPRIMLHDKKGIMEFINLLFIKNIPKLKGLILAGGKSTRMGRDKGKIQIEGRDSRAYLYDLVNAVCSETFISCRTDQKEELKEYNIIEDRISNMGPFGALLTAFMNDPDCAWLVIATDLYNVELDTIQQLISSRNPTKIATAYKKDSANFPDPLCTIWEPKSYAHLLEFMRLGYSCPRKVLINNDVEVISPTNQAWLMNVNTQEDLQKLKNEN